MFKDMKVGTRLQLVFFIITLLGAAVAAVGIRDLSELNDETDRIYQTELLGLSSVKDANLNLSNLGRALRNALLASDAATRKRFVTEAHDERRQLGSNLDKARSRFVTPRGKAMLAELDARLAAYEPVLVRLFEQVDAAPLASPTEATTFLFSTYTDKLAPVTHHLHDLSLQKEEHARQVADDTDVLYFHSRNTMIALVAFSAALGIGLALLITRQLTRQLGGEPAYAAEVAERIAAGDLVTEVQLRPGDTHSVMHAMHRMRASLADIVGQVRNGTDAIATASNEIALGTQDLSSRTERQAGALEETASSMEELTATVRHNADNARQANTLAGSASEVATRGGAVVSDVVNTMESIHASSRRIVDIITVIDGIAFQTNILALNAAVEAARAGEQGRGFAVVAGEVRTLAQRAAAAAKEIKQLIDDSVDKVGSGARLVNQAGSTMTEIVDSVRRVTDIMGEISSANQEQSGGLEQINLAVAQMDEVTQQNAALVEEAAAASDAMQEQAARLAALVSVFRIAQPAAGAAPRPAITAPARPAAARPATTKPRGLPMPARAAARSPSTPDGEGDWEAF